MGVGVGSPSWDPLGPNQFTPLVGFWPGDVRVLKWALIGTAFALCNFFEADTQVRVFHPPPEIAIYWFLSVGDLFLSVRDPTDKKHLTRKKSNTRLKILCFIAVLKNVFWSKTESSALGAPYRGRAY